MNVCEWIWRNFAEMFPSPLFATKKAAEGRGGGEHFRFVYHRNVLCPQYGCNKVYMAKVARTHILWASVRGWVSQTPNFANHILGPFFLCLSYLSLNMLVISNIRNGFSNAINRSQVLCIECWRQNGKCFVILRLTSANIQIRFPGFRVEIESVPACDEWVCVWNVWTTPSIHTKQPVIR